MWLPPFRSSPKRILLCQLAVNCSIDVGRPATPVRQASTTAKITIHFQRNRLGILSPRETQLPCFETGSENRRSRRWHTSGGQRALRKWLGEEGGGRTSRARREQAAQQAIGLEVAAGAGMLRQRSVVRTPRRQPRRKRLCRRGARPLQPQFLPLRIVESGRALSRTARTPDRGQQAILQSLGSKRRRDTQAGSAQERGKQRRLDESHRHGCIAFLHGHSEAGASFSIIRQAHVDCLGNSCNNRRLYEFLISSLGPLQVIRGRIRLYEDPR